MKRKNEKHRHFYGRVDSAESTGLCATDLRGSGEVSRSQVGEKKGVAGKLSALGFAAFCSIPGGAMAQSSVTLSGVLGAGYVYDSNVKGGTLLQASSGQLQTTRIMFSGREDLGSGTAAIFQLNMPFNIQNGQLFNNGFNASTVGFSNDRYGTLQIGRQVEASYLMVGPFASAFQWAGTLANHVGNADNLNSVVKYSNAVNYMTSKVAGFQGDATYAFSNSTQFANNRMWSVAGSYTGGVVSFAAGYFNIDRPNSTTNTSGATIADYPYTGPFVKSKAGSGVKNQNSGMGAASVNVGPWKFSTVVSDTHYHYLDATGFRINAYELNGYWFATPAVRLGIAYTFNDGAYEGTSGKPKWHQITAGTNYFLSKRTQLFVIVTYQKATNGGLAFVSGAGQSSKPNALAVGIGIQQVF
ncbi:porin [Paraburkholderia tropica]|uniref:porin n=1 Tax=Paraburkholderia tropica TaxID=92647 RepID=UPI002AB64CD1|nr:porin [Paraburkholderia tropica]